MPQQAQARWLLKNQSLLIIDDGQIRKQAFALAGKIVKKLDRLEADFEAFNEKDQKLFNDWFELTFREQRKEIENLHDEHRRLCQVHNWMIAIANQRSISLGEALLLLRLEEESYVRGSEADRQKITDERKRRDDFIRAEVERQFAQEAEDDFADDTDDLFTSSHSRPERSDEEIEELRIISEMTDKKIHKLCRSQDAAMTLLMTTLGLARSIEDYRLFLRVWDLTPSKFQNQFAREFSRETGISFRSMLEEIREGVASFADDRGAENSLDEEDFSQFNEQFIKSGSRNRQTQLSPGEVEAFKLIYRKLVRKLHPDLQDNEVSHWQKKLWDRAQQAHRRQDRTELERLYQLVLIRNQELSELRVAEILESQSWLEEELDRMQMETKGLKKLPAWGFSRKKDQTAVKRKLQKEFTQSRKAIEEQIFDIKNQHDFLEMLFKTSPRQRPARKKKGSRRHSANKAAGRRKRPTTDVQDSFFD
jgi:hypothetical protein